MIDWTLRMGACMCFVGHGVFGVIGKPAWIPYFGVVGIEPGTALVLMPAVGALDILMGCLVLLTPRPAVAAWMFAWAVWTALLRPLAGESAWEALERGGNYGVPLALFLRMAPRVSWRAYFAPARFAALTPETVRPLRRALTVTVVLLLAGHGALSMGGKATIVHNLESVMPGRASDLMPALGGFELALAAAVALRPSAPLLIFVGMWKEATEALFLTAGAPAWEWIERGGAYAAPVALAFVMARSRSALTGTR